MMFGNIEGSWGYWWMLLRLRKRWVGDRRVGCLRFGVSEGVVVFFVVVLFFLLCLFF